MELVYGTFRLIAYVWHAVLGWRTHATGDGHIPGGGPVIVASNHVGHWDPIPLGLAINRTGRWPRYMAKRELFDVPVFGRLLHHMRHVRVDRGGQGEQSLDDAARRLAEGELVVVYPEGTISTAFLPMPARGGTLRLAQRTGAPIVPAAVWGTQRIATKGRPRHWRRGTVFSVRFGPPLVIGPDDTPETAAARLTAAMTTLVEEVAATHPDGPDGPDDTWWLPARLGGSAPSLAEAAAARAAEDRARRADRAGRAGT